MFKCEHLSPTVSIYLGDCREIIPTLDKVDAVITDPPYGIEELVGGYSRFGVSDRNIANDKDLSCMIEMFDLVAKTQNNLWLVAFYSCRISPEFFRITSKFNYFGEIIWDKKITGLGHGLRYQHENIAFFKLGQVEGLLDVASVLTYFRVEERGIHPHEKPPQIMEKLISVIPCNTILDPFMGTGSTGAAAARLKKGFVGIELEQKYFDLARKKITAAINQPEAFWEK